MRYGAYTDGFYVYPGSNQVIEIAIAGVLPPLSGLLLLEVSAPPNGQTPPGGDGFPPTEVGVLRALAYGYEPADSDFGSGYLPGPPPDGTEIPSATYPVNSGRTYLYTGPFAGFSQIFSGTWASGFPRDFYKIFRLGANSIPWAETPNHLQAEMTSLINGRFQSPEAITFRVSWEFFGGAGTTSGTYDLSR